MPLPWGESGGFPTGMCQLNSDSRSLIFHELNNRCESRGVVIGPQTKVVGRNATFGGDGGGLGDDQACATSGE